MMMCHPFFQRQCILGGLASLALGKFIAIELV
jgi:hypothetical protein